MEKVYINGEFLGECEDAQTFVNKVKENRRLGNVPSSLNIYHKKDEVNIYIERGRIRRPLIVVENGKSISVVAPIPKGFSKTK